MCVLTANARDVFMAVKKQTDSTATGAVFPAKLTEPGSGPLPVTYIQVINITAYRELCCPMSHADSTHLFSTLHLMFL